MSFPQVVKKETTAFKIDCQFIDVMITNYPSLVSSNDSKTPEPRVRWLGPKRETICNGGRGNVIKKMVNNQMKKRMKIRRAITYIINDLTNRSIVPSLSQKK